MKRPPAFPLRIPHAALIAAAMLPMACQSSASRKQSAASPKENAMPASSASSGTVHPDILARFCGQSARPAPVIVHVLKDTAGNIGGYTHTVRIMDSPIHYLDREGKEVALFHIFGPDGEKARNAPIIEAMRKAYPVEELLRCPAAP